MTINVQQKASDPNISAFVMASAGTGKTKMLIDRLTRLLLKGIPLQSIICLTFTKAAAQEMRHRLFSRLYSYTRLSDDQLFLALNDLGEESINISKAKELYFILLDQQHLLKIQTIHSFCQSIVDEYAFSLGFIPPFSLIEDKKPFIIDCLNELSKDKPDLIKDISNEMGYQNFISLLEQAISLDIEKINKSFQKFDEEELIDLQFLINQLPNELQAEISASKCLTQDGEIRKKIFKKDVYDRFPEAKAIVLDVAEGYFKNNDIKKTKNLNRLNDIFFNIILNIKTNYQQQKKERSFIDFDDIIQYTYDLLNNNNAELEQKLGYSIQAILIDEAQDTSKIQWDVIACLVENMLLRESEDTSLLVVGDLKQSIYGFQGAEPFLFLKYQSLFKTSFNHYNKPFDILSLEKSYRCSKNVLALVDKLFNKNPEGLFLQKELIHYPHREIDGIVSLFPLIEKEKQSKEWQIPDIRNINDDVSLANDIVWLVERLVKEECIPPKDILILVRNRNLIVDQLIKSFSQKNIPCSGLDRFILNEHPMMEDIFYFLEWGCLKTDDYLLFQILTKIGSYNNQDLHDLALKNRPLWFHLDKEDPTIKFLNDFLSRVDYESHSSLLAFLWNHQKQFFISRYGSEAFVIYETLYDVIHKMESATPLTLQQVIWSLKTKEIDIKRDVSSTFEVKILTIHGSKGLEAPIVILADANKRQTLQKERLLEMDDRFSIKPSDADSPLFIKSIKEDTLQSLKDEEKRLLYVALTRARDHLYIFGSGQLVEGSWYDLIQQSLNMIKSQSDGYSMPITKTWDHHQLGNNKCASLTGACDHQRFEINPHNPLTGAYDHQFKNDQYDPLTGSSFEPQSALVLPSAATKQTTTHPISIVNDLLTNKGFQHFSTLNKTCIIHLISKLIIKSQVPEGFDLKNLNLSFRKFLKKINASYPVDAKASHLTPPRLTRPSVLLDYKKNVNKDLKIPDYFYKKIIAEKNNDYSSLEIERGIYLHKVIETLIGIISEERLSYLNQLVHDEKITLFDKENLLYIFKSYTYLFEGDGYLEFSLVEEGQLYRIDYFVINGNEGYIIDFKTGKRTSSKTELYKKQVEQYASLLSKIYKNLSLKCFLLWIDERAVDEWIYKA